MIQVEVDKDANIGLYVISAIMMLAVLPVAYSFIFTDSLSERIFYILWATIVLYFAFTVYKRPTKIYLTDTTLSFIGRFGNKEYAVAHVKQVSIEENTIKFTINDTEVQVDNKITGLRSFLDQLDAVNPHIKYIGI